MLLSVSGKNLAEKVKQGFDNFIDDATARVVRSVLLLQTK